MHVTLDFGSGGPPAYLLTCLPACLPTCLAKTYLHTFIPTYSRVVNADMSSRNLCNWFAVDPFLQCTRHKISRRLSLTDAHQ